MGQIYEGDDIRTFPKNSNIPQSDITVPCEICGRPTTFTGTKRCNSCWEMERGLDFFIHFDKEKAKKWLQDKLKELGD